MFYLLLAITTVVIFVVAYFVMKNTITEEARQKRQSNSSQTISKRPRDDSRRLDYRYADRHIFVRGKDVFTGVRLVAETDEYASHEELLTKVRAASDALESLVGGTTLPFQVRVTHRPITAEEWAEDAIAHCWDPTPNCKRHLRGTAEYLALSDTARPEAYLIVQIGTASAPATKHSATLVGVADEQFDPDEVARWEALAADVHQKLSTLDVVPMRRDDLLWLIRKPLSGHFAPQPVVSAPSRPWGAGEFALATAFDATNYRNGLVIHRDNDDLAYGPLGQEMDSHTCVLIATDWPKQMPFRRQTAWMRYIGNISGAQVEINYRGVLLPYKEFRKKADKILDDLSDEERDRKRGIASSRDPHAEAAPPDRETQQHMEEASRLVGDIREHRFPGVDAQITLLLSAYTAEALNALVREVQTKCSDALDITFERPKTAQWRLMEAFLPGTPPAVATMPRVQMQEASTFGVGLANAGAEVGDNTEVAVSGKTLGWRGHYIGKSSEVPTHYSTPVGPSRNKGGGVAIIGASGGGKSSLALLKFHQESEAGTECVALDPKVDFAQFVYYICFGPQVNHPDFRSEAAAGLLGTPESQFTVINQRYWDDTEIIDVMKGKDGTFDPWQITGDLAAGESLAQTMLEEFVGPKDWGECRLPVRHALGAARRDYEARRAEAQKNGTPIEDVPLPTLWNIVDRVIDNADEVATDESAQFRDRQEAQLAAEVLQALRRLPASRLAFSPTPVKEKRARKRRTIYTLRGMETPPPAKAPEHWSQPERLCATIMYILTRQIAGMLEVKEVPNPVTGKIGMPPTALFIDEAYAVTSLDSGRAVVMTALAQARAYAMTIVLIDQQAKRLAKIEEDSDEATGNQFHSVFVFQQSTMDEARRAVPLLGRESNTEAVARAVLPVNSGGMMRTGVCVMRDVDARVATVNVDLVYREVRAASDTNPATRAESQSAPISPNVDDWSFTEDDEVSDVTASSEYEPVEHDSADDEQAQTPVGAGSNS